MDSEACFRVTLQSHDKSEVTFTATGGRSIARSAANAGYRLTTGCLQGRCAICRAQLISGKVGPARRPSRNAVGDPLRRADGCILLCSVSPLSDVVVAPLSPWDGDP